MKVLKRKKKSFIIWADDDWMNYALHEFKYRIIEKSDFGVFHYTKSGCYEGKPRKVRITIEELDLND